MAIVIPERAPSREPGMTFRAPLWIPGSRFACPGMTAFRNDGFIG
jgi:hypothetical protein